MADGFLRKPLIVAAIGLAIPAAIDTAFAYRRVHYGELIPREPFVAKRIATPSSIVLVNLRCDQSCLERLVAGIHDEVIFVSTVAQARNQRTPLEPPYPAFRYTILRRMPNECPPDPTNESERQWMTAPVVALRARGLCPLIESVVAPNEGVFIVNEAMRVPVKEAAVEFKPRFLATRLPGQVSYYNATEVQQRSASRIEVLGRAEAYEAPGYLGFPPLVGCWERPDNIVAIVPFGEPGCGLWRRTTQGGDQSGRFSNGEWVYARLFQQR